MWALAAGGAECLLDARPVHVAAKHGKLLRRAVDGRVIVLAADFVVAWHPVGEVILLGRVHEHAPHRTAAGLPLVHEDEGHLERRLRAPLRC